MNQKINFLYIACNRPSLSILSGILLGVEKEYFCIPKLHIPPLQVKYEMQKYSCGQNNMYIIGEVTL